MTLYGYVDNSPPGTDIAHPCGTRQGAGGTGTYADPITFATDVQEMAWCQVIYVPYMERYFIHEDECSECDHDWKKPGMPTASTCGRGQRRLVASPREEGASAMRADVDPGELGQGSEQPDHHRRSAVRSPGGRHAHLLASHQLLERALASIRPDDAGRSVKAGRSVDIGDGGDHEAEHEQGPGPPGVDEGDRRRTTAATPGSRSGGSSGAGWLEAFHDGTSLGTASRLIERGPRQRANGHAPPTVT